MKNIFFNKTVLVTGHTGFKGSWLSIWLTYLGARVVGASIKSLDSPSNFSVSYVRDVIKDYRVDIRDKAAVKRLVTKTQPDFIFHLAAQSLVLQSYEKPLETMETNALGSANILNALTFLKKKIVAIMITSDKVYDNVEWVWGYRETDPLGGKDPYSASKGMAELAISSYMQSFFNKPNSNIRIGIARAGNVIGGGDWAVDRIVPDCMKAWSKNQIVDIRNPHSTRPWQHVLEPLSGYLLLASNLAEEKKLNGQAYNFGPSLEQNYPVRELINEMSNYWDKVKWNDISGDENILQEAGLLKLNCDKALSDLKWKSTLEFEETIKMTVDWYKHYYQNQNKSMYNFTISQIIKYLEIAKSRNIAWASND